MGVGAGIRGTAGAVEMEADRKVIRAFPAIGGFDQIPVGELADTAEMVGAAADIASVAAVFISA
jgi:hypothetical protein